VYTLNKPKLLIVMCIFCMLAAKLKTTTTNLHTLLFSAGCSPHSLSKTHTYNSVP